MTEAIEERGWYVSKGLVVIGVGVALFALAAVVLLWMGIHGWRAARRAGATSCSSRSAAAPWPTPSRS